MHSIPSWPSWPSKPWLPFSGTGLGTISWLSVVTIAAAPVSPEMVVSRDFFQVHCSLVPDRLRAPWLWDLCLRSHVKEMSVILTCRRRYELLLDEKQKDIDCILATYVFSRVSILIDKGVLHYGRGSSTDTMGVRRTNFTKSRSSGNLQIIER